MFGRAGRVCKKSVNFPSTQVLSPDFLPPIATRSFGAAAPFLTVLQSWLGGRINNGAGGSNPGNGVTGKQSASDGAPLPKTLWGGQEKQDVGSSPARYPTRLGARKAGSAGAGGGPVEPTTGSPITPRSGYRGRKKIGTAGRVRECWGTSFLTLIGTKRGHPEEPPSRWRSWNQSGSQTFMGLWN